jgi:anti-sigma B factor antagonist
VDLRGLPRGASIPLQERGSAPRATGGKLSDVSDDLVSPLREHPVLGVETRDGAVIVRLAGELDLYNAEDVRTALAQAIDTAPLRLVIDMAAVEFVDSTALGVLIEARSRLGHDALLLAAPQVETRRTLQISGLDRHLTVHDSVDDALTA